MDSGRVIARGNGRKMRSKAVFLSADRADHLTQTPCGTNRPERTGYRNKSNMYEYFTVNDLSVRSGRSNSSYSPRVSV